MTDVSVPDLAIGTRVEMTFRRIYTALGVHNYFWKARPLEGAPVASEPASTAPSATTAPSASTAPSATTALSAKTEE
jgi:hypothetical protein